MKYFLRSQRLTLFLIVALLSCATFVKGQTSRFTYQGRFTDNGATANGTYEMQFRLFDSVSGGSQIGSTITNTTVNVSNGVFTVQLDYGASAFSGANRYLEIGLRPAGDSNPFTFLAPRQQLTAAIYAIRASSAASADSATSATNSTQLGGVNANQYVQTNDARLTDARTPTAGSSNYIQNTPNQQTGNFNISGNGTAAGSLSASSINTSTNYKIGGQPILHVSGNTFTPRGNTFAGSDAGTSTTPIIDNSGLDGNNNSFFGNSAGPVNTTGAGNSFFGSMSGLSNLTGAFNSFIGATAGNDNTTGNGNTFVGVSAGVANKTGAKNVFVGVNAGAINKAGNDLTAIGTLANVSTDNLTNATAIGANASVSQSNSLVLGSIKNVNFALEDTNVGIGTTAPKSKLHIVFGPNNLQLGHAGCSSGLGIGFGATMSGCNNFALLGSGLNTVVNRPAGGSILFAENNISQMTIASGGAVSINTLGAAGSTSLCRNASNQISNCSSSLRYKTNIQAFTSGLSLLTRLRPITFDWKDGGLHDLGFGAEDIAAVEPLLVTRNDKGEVEGVKYDRVTAVLVNAVKEQQQQIQQQQAQLKQQQQQIDSLRRLVARRSRSGRK